MMTGGEPGGMFLHPQLYIDTFADRRGAPGTNMMTSVRAGQDVSSPLNVYEHTC
jgi:hypothetical protein